MLGFAKSTKAVINYFLQQEPEKYQFLVSEKKSRADFDEEEISDLESKGLVFEFAEQSFDFIKEAERVIVSPGIPPTNPLIKQIQAAALKLQTDTDLFAETIAHDYVAVTGTNGKTTTVKLLAQILGSEALGNVGKACFEFPDLAIEKKQAAWQKNYVLELSSFQIHYSQLSRAPKIAAYLNFSDDHLDWYSSLDDYRADKEKLILETLKRKEAQVLLNYDDAACRDLAERIREKNRVSFFSTKEDLSQLDGLHAYVDAGVLTLSKNKLKKPILAREKLLLPGDHNLANVLAAMFIADALGTPLEHLQKELASFQGVEHRLEFVAEVDSKRFYNDSKATNPHSAIQAYSSFDSSIAILGGYEKNLDYKNLYDCLKHHVQKIILLGATAERMEAELNSLGFVGLERAADLKEAIKIAVSFPDAIPVVFSPASSSFDMFKNFEDRGQQFKAAVSDILKM